MTLSTLLTLFVVPCAYRLLARLERKNYAVAVGEADEPLETAPLSS